MEEKWYFTEDNSIGDDFSDHGTEIFKNNNDGASKFKKFAREMVQNSIDVKNEQINEPLIVEFNLFEVEKNDLPNFDGLIEHIDGTISYCEIKNKKNNAYNTSKLEKNILKKDKIQILKISDYNTIGICGSKDLKSEKSKWQGLIYNEGDSVKDSSNSLGSFGLGKGAAFAMSNLRTVFYNTKDVDGNRAFEGVTRQYVSYVNNKKKNFKGYFARVENGEVLPFVDDEIKKYSSIFERNSPGSDIYVLEPNISILSLESIKWFLIESIICNFFVAIRDGALEVKVQGTEVNQGNLDNIFVFLNDFYEKNNLEKSDSLIATGQYLKALDYGKMISENLKGFGEINLWLYKDSNIKGKNVAIIRKNGMFIRNLDVKYANQKFAGVVIVQGSEGVEFLKSIEDPNHLDFDPSRPTSHEEYGSTEDKQKRLNQFYTWIKEHAKDFTKIQSEESFNLSGMEDYIQMPSNEEKKYNPRNMEPKIIKSKPLNTTKSRVAKKTKVTKGPNGVTLISPDPTGTGTGKPNPTTKPTTTPVEEPNSDRKGFIKSYEASYELGPVIKHNENESILIFEITESNKDFKLKISAVDEDGNENGLLPNIIYAYDLTNDVELECKHHIVYGLKCFGVVKIILKFDEPIVSCIKPIVYWEE